MKLCEKGLIETYKSPHNKKEKYFRLTPEGEEAKRQYEELNRKAAANMRAYLCALSIDEKKTIMDFMQKQRNICRRAALAADASRKTKRRAFRRKKE